MNNQPKAPASHENHYSLWDLDNCLSDDRWRSPLIDWHLEGNERYSRYDAQMLKDSRAYSQEWSIITAISTPIFITGRRERWREMTREWIVKNLPMRRDGKLEWQSHPMLYMRPNDCEDKPVDVKQKLLSQVLQEVARSRIIAAFDDLASIVEMYRQHGIPAAVLRVHDPRETYKPNEL